MTPRDLYPAVGARTTFFVLTKCLFPLACDLL